MNHLTQTQLQEYIDKALDRQESLRVEDHLKECAECSNRLAVVGLVDRGIREIPLETVSANFTRAVMRSLRLSGMGGLLRQIVLNLLPLVGAILVLVFVVGVLSGDSPAAAEGTQSEEYARSVQDTVGDVMTSGSAFLLKWIGTIVGFSAGIPSVRLIIGLALAFAAVALFDEFVFVPMMRKKG